MIGAFYCGAGTLRCHPYERGLLLWGWNTELSPLWEGTAVVRLEHRVVALMRGDWYCEAGTQSYRPYERGLLLWGWNTELSPLWEGAAILRLEHRVVALMRGDWYCELCHELSSSISANSKLPLAANTANVCLASVPWYIASFEILAEFCPERFGVLFCSVVLCSRYTP